MVNIKTGTVGMKTALHILSVHAITPNPYIEILAKGIASKSIHVDSDINAFWDRQQQYDIIQIHWPEWIFYSYNGRLPDKEFGERLTETLHLWKKSGTKIVYTQHNEKTHYVKGEEVRTNLYEILESEADAIVHLGYFSKNQMLENKYLSDKTHVVIPHHIFDTYFQRSVSQIEARKALDIHERFKVILVFGAFRDEEEILLTQNVFEQLDEPNKYLFAPSWYHDGWHEYYNDHITPEGNSWLGTGSVDRDMLPYCFSAADVVFIQRIRNLNSGNLPMAFLFNKTVVSPAIGNMTEYLDNINNFSFDPFDLTSVNNALKKGLERAKYPQVNEVYARQQWNTAKICEQYRQLYQHITC